MKWRFSFIALGACLAACTGEVTAPKVANADFEQAGSDWTSENGTVVVVPEAAHAGKGGLRVTDESPTEYVRIESEPISITPGAEYKLTFWANQVSGHGVNAILWFLDDDEKRIEGEDGQRDLAGPKDGTTGWEQFSITVRAPANAAYAQIYVQSNRVAIAVVDFDDFRLERMD